MTELTPLCRLCNQRHGLRTACTNIMRAAAEELAVERPPLPEWRNDHGRDCTCMDCVLRRIA